MGRLPGSPASFTKYVSSVYSWADKMPIKPERKKRRKRAKEFVVRAIDDDGQPVEFRAREAEDLD